MQTSTIKFSQIEDRIDAEYYKPEYLGIERFFSHSKNIFTIGEIIKSIQHPKEFKREYSTIGGIPYLRVSNVKDGYINLSDIEYVYADRNIGLSKINNGNILITRSGTVGIPVLVTSEFDEMLISADFLKLVLKEKINNLSINPYFIYTFLSSKLGLAQSQRKLIGALQKHINTEGLSSIKIPIPSQPFQQKIEEMVKEAQKKRKLADEKYKEAEEILNKELGLENLDLSTQKTFEAKFSEAEDRFDPEYYKPIYKNVYKYLKKKSKPLTEVCKIIKTKISPQNNPEKIFNYIEIGGINNSTGEIEKVLYLHGWEVPSGVKYVVKNNDVLLSAVRTYLKGIALVNNNHEGNIATTGFHVLREPIIKPETLFLFLRSRLGLIQFEKFFLGSTYPVIKNYDLKNIMIPILSQSLQQKISSLIQESFKLHQEAKELIDRAKREVEEMVERR